MPEDPINHLAPVLGSGKPHLLVVENDSNDAKLIQLAFRSVSDCGSVFLSRNVSEARAYVRGAGMYADRVRFPVPAAIISDFRMEGETGVQFLKWLRSQPELADIPFVLLTGSASPADIKQANESGANRTVRKPVNSEEFRTTLREIAQWLCSRPVASAA